MTFRKQLNRRDWWLEIIQENRDFISELPSAALVSESAFRDYVTTGSHREVNFKPSVDELSASTLNGLWNFIQHHAKFDMEAGNFDAFNRAFRRKYPSN